MGIDANLPTNQPKAPSQDQQRDSQGPLCAPRSGPQLRNASRPASKTGDALFKLAMDYYKGQDVAKDIPLAIKILQKAAEAGNPAASYKLAMMAYLGTEVPRDASKAISAFTASAEMGHPPSQYALGMIFFHGRDTERDLLRATAWLERAAERGHLMAKTNLGYILAQDLGEQKDEKRAIEMLKDASRDGMSAATFNLGMIYNGEGRSRADHKRANHYLKKAAARGESDALVELAIRRDKPDTPNADPASHALLHEAAGLHNVRAMRLLALAYEEGIGVESDMRKAAEWYEAAAERGDTYLQCQLGHMHYLGLCGQDNRELAARWFAKAAEQGDIPAKHMLGLLLLRGEAGEQDINGGLTLLKEAALAGHLDSQLELAIEFRLGRYVPENKAEALRWFAEAADLLDPQAELALAEMYSRGEGVEIDLSKAQLYLERAREDLPKIKDQHLRSIRLTIAIEELGESLLKQLQSSGHAPIMARLKGVADSLLRRAENSFAGLPRIIGDALNLLRQVPLVRDLLR